MQVVEAQVLALHLPPSIHGAFVGNAAQLQNSSSSEPLLIAAALAAVYMVLGILYESYVHPLTILSTLPSAKVGALVALWVFGEDFSLMAMIGVILLIGIVRKNAIMLVDFALDAERERGVPAKQAMREAGLLRFLPIMMTTFAAALGALPLILGNGYGSRTAAAAWHRDYQRPGCQSGTDTLYHADHLSLSGQGGAILLIHHAGPTKRFPDEHDAIIVTAYCSRAWLDMWVAEREQADRVAPGVRSGAPKRSGLDGRLPGFCNSRFKTHRTRQ